MIYYFPGADHSLPSGGVKTHYRHVEILTDAGIPATILHVRPSFHPGWFESHASIAYIPEVELSTNDILVVNEIMGPQTATLAPGVRKVIFAQNVHYTWRGWPTPPESPAPQVDPEIAATLVLTDYERDFLRWVYPKHPIHVTPHGIDPLRFPLGTSKRKQIAYMPRKHADEAQQVFGYLHARGSLKGWDVVAIDGMTEAETSKVLQESLIFVPFGYPEGGTIPPFEAMAAGCHVVGYGGFASDALMGRCGGVVTPSGDSCALVRELDHTLGCEVEYLARWGQDNSRDVGRLLSMENERAAVLGAWQKIGV